MGDDRLPDLSAPKPEALGQLAEYRLVEKLGQGGMGIVYKAVHTELDRVVALKLLPLGLMNDEQAVTRFKREIRAVGQLDHPNIVRAYDARESGGTHFLVMELVTGLDLAELVRRVDPIPVADACEVVRQVALGLDCAHQQTLVHRDIKPSNLILSDSGVVKILDMGLARFRILQPSDSDVTISGQALGTPDYMAPEQVHDSRSADIRADLYSLGCTLYVLLACQTPFCGRAYRTAFDKMSAHVHDAPTPVGQYRTDIPDGLVAILERLMAKQPEARYSTPAELVDALTPFTAGSDLRSLVAVAQGRSPTPRPRAEPTGKVPLPISTRPTRRRWLIVGIACVLAMLALSAVVAYRLGPDRDAILTRPPIIPATESHQDSTLPGWIVISWTLPGTGKPDLWLFDPNGERRIQLTDDPNSFDNHPCFSPDGRRIAFIRGVRFDQPTSLWVCNANGSEPREVAAPESPTERFLSPVWLSNTRLCYTRDPTLDRRPDMEAWETDVEDPQPQLMFRFSDVLSGENGVVTGASPNEHQLLVVAQTGWTGPTSNVYVTNRQGQLVHTLWQDDPDDRKDARALWSPEANRIAWHHNFTRGLLAEQFYYGVGLACRNTNGSWSSQLQSNRELLVTPLAWSPGQPQLLCAQMSPDESQATLLLMDDRFETVRELFQLETYGWQLGQRDFGRLADWAILPDDVQFSP